MINSFDGRFAFLSNFFNSPITIEGITYPTVEHFFQSQKTINSEQRRIIIEQSTPGRAKRKGEKAALRSDWEQIKVKTMLLGLKEKFKNPVLAKQLLSTGDERLVEGNYWHDNFWGDCICEKCKNIPGRNMLGNLLEQIRTELKE